MLGAHALVGEDITLPACVTHAYAETHTLKYDVVRCMLCSVMSTCSYRPTTGLPTKAKVFTNRATPDKKENGHESHCPSNIQPSTPAKTLFILITRRKKDSKLRRDIMYYGVREEWPSSA